jgi:hypothetical protein
MKRFTSALLIIILLLQCIFVPSLVPSAVWASADSIELTLVERENILKSRYQAYVSAVESGADTTQITYLKNQLDEAQLAWELQKEHPDQPITSTDIALAESELPSGKLSDDERAKSIGALMTIGGTAVACIGSLGLMAAAPAAIIAAGLAIPGTWMWQWGKTTPKIETTKDYFLHLKDRIKEKKTQNGIGAMVSIAGLSMLTFGALGVMSAVPAIAIGSTLGIVGTYLWHWGIDKPDFLKPNWQKKNSKERRIENIGVSLSIAGTAAMALGSLAFVPMAPAVLIGSALSMAGAYLWKFGVEKPKLIELIRGEKNSSTSTLQRIPAY